MVHAKSLDELYPEVGLKSGELDFACIYKSSSQGWSINIIVSEFGLYEPVEQAKYFSIGGQLLEGGAIIFRADESGETINMVDAPPVMFYRSHEDVERAIAGGEIVRPQVLINKEVIWEWPQQRVMK
jgi:hypothetical protein